MPVSRTSLTRRPVLGLRTGPSGRIGLRLLRFFFGALTSSPCYGPFGCCPQPRPYHRRNGVLVPVVRFGPERKTFSTVLRPFRHRPRSACRFPERHSRDVRYLAFLPVRPDGSVLDCCGSPSERCPRCPVTGPSVLAPNRCLTTAERCSCVGRSVWTRTGDVFHSPAALPIRWSAFSWASTSLAHSVARPGFSRAFTDSCRPNRFPERPSRDVRYLAFLPNRPDGSALDCCGPPSERCPRCPVTGPSVLAPNRSRTTAERCSCPGRSVWTRTGDVFHSPAALPILPSALAGLPPALPFRFDPSGL
jgi:hypothetical protein